MERVAIVLLLVAVASAYPYSPYTDHKGESKNLKLSEEAVAAYLKSKMEDEKLEPAKIMDYVESLLQGARKGVKGVTDAPSKWRTCWLLFAYPLHACDMHGYNSTCCCKSCPLPPTCISF
jgi:hypothetical protein